MSYSLHHGCCLEVLKTLADGSVDSVVTDPPYGLSFMGKKWDYDVPSEEVWRECLRVLKPGGHLLAFAGTRTQHRMAVRIEDGGFEIRDMIAWVYGSGFPKSHNLQGEHKGWGTALKPAFEPLTVARKPLIGTVAENVQQHGTGAINVDGCRVGTEQTKTCEKTEMYGTSGRAKDQAQGFRPRRYDNRHQPEKINPPGRWPANLIHDGSEDVVGLFPAKAGAAAPVKKGFDGASNGIYGNFSDKGDDGASFYGDTGSAARFFYCAKASKHDREEGLDSFVPAKTNDGRPIDADNAYQRGATMRRNTHPTVKPTELMRYLCRLVTPPNGTVLDPFMGSGSTGKAAMLEGFRFIGIEREEEYVALAKARIEAVKEAA
jgi:site-specific DNA-methyltransferase (adenine-specific)